MASAGSGKAHYLSGLSEYALLQILLMWKIRTEPSCYRPRHRLGVLFIADGSQAIFTFISRRLVSHHQNTRIFGELLGPCFKTVGKRPCYPLPKERACQRNDEALYRPLIQVYSIYLPEPEDPSRRKDARNPVTHPVDNEGPRYFVEDSLSAMYSFPTSGPPVQAQERHQSLRTLTQTTTDSRRLRGTEFSQSRVLYPWRSTMSKAFSLSFQSAFHLSFTLLVRYRTWCNI